MLNFNKKIVVGVSVTQEIGLEVAQIDFENKKILKYASRNLEYNGNDRSIIDLDLFNESLLELLEELEIPKGSQIVLNIPTVDFMIMDYRAAMTSEEVNSAFEEEFSTHPVFKDDVPSVSFTSSPLTTMQMSKYVCTAAQRTTLIEIALRIKEMGYSLIAIDCCINSTINALSYNERIDPTEDSNWVLLLVEGNYCRIITMQGANYVAYQEVKISIGEVLGDEENLSTIINAVDPILGIIPSKCLYIISKTKVISASLLAEKIAFRGQIIHQDSNLYNNTQYLEVEETIDEATAKTISIDVIGAAIRREFYDYTPYHLNLFNEQLGDIYISEQPPVIYINNRKIILSIENMVVAAIAFFVIALIPIITSLVLLNKEISNKKNSIKKIEKEIQQVQDFLKKNEAISTDMFDEGDEIRIGLVHNKNIYTYYSIVGTEIPHKLWLTSLKLGDNVTIEGQADNLESIYSFFRSLKDYTPNSGIKIQKLGLASKSKIEVIDEEKMDTSSIVNSMNANFYQFRISDTTEEVDESEKDSKDKKNKKGKKSLPNLEPID